jgi:hypothetical protein
MCRATYGLDKTESGKSKKAVEEKLCRENPRMNHNLDTFEEGQLLG